MRYHTVDKTVTPLQPQLQQQFSYQEKLVKWNPFSVKNLALCYEFRTQDAPQSVQLIPDACLDFLFRFNTAGASAVVTGVQTQPLDLVLEPNTVYFGFKPYSPKGMRRLNTHWCELGEQQVDLGDLLPCQSILEELMGAHNFRGRIETMQNFALENLTDSAYSPDFVEYSELKLCHARGNLQIGRAHV